MPWGRPVHSPVTDTLASEATALGFDGFAAVVWAPCTDAQPVAYVASNFHRDWLTRGDRARDKHTIDPIAQWCQVHDRPLVWSEDTFAEAQAFRREAAGFGLRHGWSMAVRDALGVRGLFSLARATEPLGAHELAEKQAAMRMLAHRAHRMVLVEWRAHWLRAYGEPLTSREIDVLRWAADGKTARDTADILAIETTTVRFHMANAMGKLGTDNAAGAVFRALVLGLLHGRPGARAQDREQG